MEIVGYSERGLLNSLLYEIRYSQNNLRLLNEFLCLISFPYDNEVRFDTKHAKVLIEQSFSDFGTADSLLLLDNGQNKQCVFVEAKVKTAQYKSWPIRREFGFFEDGIRQDKANSSNLFVQLYYKVILIKGLQNGTLFEDEGISLPECLSKESKGNRKIGKNPVVLRATESLKQYSSHAFFVALVPEDRSEIERFYLDTLRNFKPGGFQDWNVENWGYILWADVEDFCKKQGLEETLKVFKFNKGQIY
jgi:hypothetical protein